LNSRPLRPDARDYATDHLLWSPTETASRPFTDRSGKSWDCTDLEHWFRAFGEARNDIIHGDAAPLDFDYEEDGSAYNGPMFHTAERLLRETTKVELTRLGHDRLFYEATTRAICRHLENLANWYQRPRPSCSIGSSTPRITSISTDAATGPTAPQRNRPGDKSRHRLEQSTGTSCWIT